MSNLFSGWCKNNRFITGKFGTDTRKIFQWWGYLNTGTSFWGDCGILLTEGSKNKGGNDVTELTCWGGMEKVTTSYVLQVLPGLSWCTCAAVCGWEASVSGSEISHPGMWQRQIYGTNPSTGFFLEAALRERLTAFFCGFWNYQHTEINGVLSIQLLSVSRSYRYISSASSCIWPSNGKSENQN